MKSVSIKKIVSHGLIYAFLFVISGIVIYPILYSFMGSLKPVSELLTGNTFFPQEVVWRNYVRAFKEAKFFTYTGNSIFYSVAGTIISMFNVCALGFCLARQDFAGKKILRLLILGTMFVALGPMTLYPKLEIMRSLGITGTRLSILLGIITTSSAEVFIFEAYFRSQGKEIDEAAEIDGCNLFQRFFYMGLPLGKPLIGTFSVIFFNRIWNDFFWPYVMTFTNTKIQPLVVAVIALKDSTGEAATEWGLLLAGASLAILPVVIVYICTSKWVVAGVTEGAVKM
ncbi:carbohydrate ABC transporter permease [Cellulosilyticum sp. I15G10I2]|uniref:carbohydrate ABC transporter permease n=1 Tax=Cellulosilyticum sp. I15G10I2 TaxID=1892843 RepID=UPI00085BF4F2|nr:carbohydrate ABC transporter permease [Cellulosilyticum sp. I15G10I2]